MKKLILASGRQAPHHWSLPHHHHGHCPILISSHSTFIHSIHSIHNNNLNISACDIKLSPLKPATPSRAGSPSSCSPPSPFKPFIHRHARQTLSLFFSSSTASSTASTNQSFKMMTNSGIESEFKLKDGLTLYTKEWKAAQADAPQASVVFLHGFSDHCNAYYELFPELAKMGIEVFAFDQRGWGRSALDKKAWGSSGGTSTILADVDEIVASRLAHVKTYASPPPLFLVGHSAGGGLCLTYAVSGSYRSSLAGFVVWSPYLDLAKENRPPPGKIFIGRIAGKLLPNQQLYNKSDHSKMSRDKQVCDDMANDKLCHDTGTLIGFSDMISRGERLQKAELVNQLNAEKPILVMHGTSDMVTDYTASKKFFDMAKVNDKQFKSYENGYHKLHADAPETVPVFANDVGSWILERSSKSTATTSAAPAAHL